MTIFFRSNLLNLKGLEYEQEAVHLTKDGGEQSRQNMMASIRNLVPTLIDNERTFFQSMAIMEYLEEAMRSRLCCRGIRLVERGAALANISL